MGKKKWGYKMALGGSGCSLRTEWLVEMHKALASVHSAAKEREKEKNDPKNREEISVHFI